MAALITHPSSVMTIVAVVVHVINPKRSPDPKAYVHVTCLGLHAMLRPSCTPIRI